MPLGRRVWPLAMLLLAACGGVIGLLVAMSRTGRAESDFALHDGDRVVFYGDSITEQHLYTNFVEEYVLTRFPGMDVRFTNSGWRGDRVSGGTGGPIDRRLDRDVIAHQPTVVTIMLGMNDGGYRPFDPGLFAPYREGYEQIVSRLRRALPGVRLTLAQPSPYDDVTRPPAFPGGYNAVLEQYSAFVRDLAARDGTLTADLNTPVVAALRQAAALDPALAPTLVPDRIHPAPAGHLLLAAALLKAWNAPAMVSSVSLDAAGQRVVEATNTRLLRLRVADRITWIAKDDALPLPLDLGDPAMRLALRASDFVETLDQQPLRVTGLPAARYRLTIDDMPVGRFTREELAAGVNLALLPTPMRRQAAQVHALTMAHHDVQFLRWRQVQLPLETQPSPRLAALLPRLAALEAELVQRQRAAAQPRLRRFALVPAR